MTVRVQRSLHFERTSLARSCTHASRCADGILTPHPPWLRWSRIDSVLGMLADILSAGISGQARDGEAGASSRALGKSVPQPPYG